MKTLTKGAVGTEVKLLQGMLNIQGFPVKVDGSFGGITDVAVRAFQRSRGLNVDGSVGFRTQAKLGFVKTMDVRIVAMAIPFGAINQARVCLMDGQKSSVDKMGRVFGCNFVMNGGLFDTHTTRDCSDVVINGKLNNGGNYSDIGIAMGRANFDFVGMYQSKTSFCLGKSVDFQGGCPSLIVDGKECLGLKGLPLNFMRTRTRRTCSGVTSTHFYALFSLKNCSLYDMELEGELLGLKCMINHDGGGSQSLYLGGGIAIATDGRGIPSGIGLNVNPF